VFLSGSPNCATQLKRQFQSLFHYRLTKLSRASDRKIRRQGALNLHEFRIDLHDCTRIGETQFGCNLLLPQSLNQSDQQLMTEAPHHLCQRCFFGGGSACNFARSNLDIFGASLACTGVVSVDSNSPTSCSTAANRKIHSLLSP